MHAADRKLKASLLSHWISAGHHAVYCIAVKEAERSIAGSVFLWAKPLWEAALRSVFGISGDSDDEYCLLAIHDVGATQVAFVVHRRLLTRVSHQP